MCVKSSLTPTGAATAAVTPFRQLSASPKLAAPILTTPPPRNAFAGLLYAFRIRDAYLGAVAFTTILSKASPLLLANVAAQVSETLEVQLTCIWITVAMVAMMIFTLIVSFFIKYPHMPAHPGTVIGMISYLQDGNLSKALGEFGTRDQRESDKEVSALRGRYCYNANDSSKQPAGIRLLGAEENGSMV